MRRKSLILLLLAICLPWAAMAQQELANYTFSTGTSTSKWVNVTSESLLVSGGDSKASSVLNIGFNFPFDNTTYDKFSVNTDGNLRLGSTATGTSQYTTPFSSSNANSNNPKINAFGCDGYATANNYVKYQNESDKLVVEFCMNTYSQRSNTSLKYKWQVHLYKNGDIEIVFPSDSEIPSTLPSVAHQCGLCVNSSDGWIITSSNNTATHFTSGSSTTNSSGTWFDANRYYRFERPVLAYPQPTNLHLSGSDHESASFAWSTPEAGPNPLTGYAYEYKPASQANWSDNWTQLNDASATTLTISGLAVSTSYNFRMKALYSGHESEIVTTDFSTTAVATVVGDSWSDDFEAATCGWDILNSDNSSIVNRWTYGSGTSYEGSQSLYVSNDGGSTYAYTQSTTSTKVYAAKLFKFATTKYLFSFKWQCQGESNYDFLRVALVPGSQILTPGTDHTSIGTNSLPEGWIAIDGGNKLNVMGTEWQNCDAPVDVTAGNYYVVFVWRNDGSGGSNPPAAVDNFSITRVTCPYDVAGLAENNTITSNSANLTWTSDATQWQVEYSDNSNFEDATSNLVSTTSYNITGLFAATTYYARVRAYCGVDDYGIWSDVYQFNTECPASYTLPYTWGFEGPNTTGSYQMPLCWTRMGSSTNYPQITTTNPHGGTRALYFYKTSGTSSQNEIAALPSVDANLNTVRVVFYGKLGSGSDGTINVGYVADLADATTFNSVETVTLTTDYEKYTVMFKNVGNATGNIAFQALYNTAYAYLYIDDVTVEEIPNCLEPTGVAEEWHTATESSLTFDWTAGGTETIWKLQYKKSNESEWTTLATPVTSKPYQLSGLDHSTIYNVRVAAWCTPSDPDGISGYSNPATASTKCPAITTYPVFYGFETSEGFPANASTPTTNQLGACWRNEATVQTGTYPTRVWGTSTTSKHTGSQALVLPDKGSSSSTEANCAKTMLVFPPMEFTNAEGYILSFWIYRNGTASDAEGFKVYVSNTDTISSNAVELGHYSRNYAQPYPVAESTSAWYQYETEPITMTGTVYLIFEGHSYYHSGTYVDDITIKERIVVTANQIVASNPGENQMTWNQFAQYVNQAAEFTHDTITLMNDITVTTMAGTEASPFTGIFIGNGKTMSVNITSDETAAAPFHYISGATIENLNVTGSVVQTNTDNEGYHTGGLVGYSWSGTNTIKNCHVSTNITITTLGGGIIGHAKSSTVNLIGCVYDGTITNAVNSTDANRGVGGLVGWFDGGTFNVTNCIYDGTYTQNEGVSIYFHPIACKTGGGSVSTTLNNCYYFCDDPATDSSDGANNIVTSNTRKAYSITGTEGISVANAGEATVYNVGGFTGYGTWGGILYDGTNYGGQGKTLTLALSNSSTGGYQANHGTLTPSGDNYTLVMEAYDTEILPYCAEPTLSTNGVTAHGVTITWDYTAGEVYEYALATAADEYAHSSWTVINSGSKTYTDLAASTAYRFYVRKKCLENLYSDETYIDFSTLAGNLAPTNLAVDASSITGHTATISWNGVATNTWHESYNLYVSTEETLPQTPTQSNFILDVTSPYQLTGLDGVTTYYVWVYDQCGSDGPSAWTGPVSFTTDVTCPAPTGLEVNNITNHTATFTWSGTSESYKVSVGTTDYTATPTTETWQEGFEHSGSMPEGWTHIGYGSVDMYSTSSSRVHDGTYSMRFYNATSDNVVVLPDFGTETRLLTISYWSLAESSSNSGSFAVGYVTDANDASTFREVNSNTAGSHTSYTHVENISLAEAPVGARIAFRHTSAASNYWWWIDDITVSGPVYPLAWAEYTTRDLTYTVERLNPNTAYQVKVQGNCGDEDGVSDETDVIPFITDIACPAPTALAANNITNSTAQISWTNYYASEWTVAFSTDGTIFTERPATTNPYPLTGLSDLTEYTVKVYSKCGGTDGDSEYSEEITFTTLSNCSAPAELSATATASTATLSWSGAQDSYNVRYRKVITVPVDVNDTYGFEDGTMQGWTSYDEDGDNKGWAVYSSTAHEGSNCVRSEYNSSAVPNDWLISPQISFGGSLSFYAKGNSSGTTEKFQVYISTTGTDISNFTAISDEITAPDSYAMYEYDLSNYSGNGYVAIKHTAAKDQYWLYVDDIQITASIAGEYGAWNETNTNVTSPLPIEDLEYNTTYEWQVQGINANCTETSGVTNWSESAIFTIPYPTYTKTIAGVGAEGWTNNGNGGYYLIASPLAEAVAPTAVSGMITDDYMGNNATVENSTYDLYSFNQAQDDEWQNYRAGAFDNLVNGQGYLYASKTGTTLSVTGAPGTNNVVTLSVAENTDGFGSYNLVGNPLGVEAYLPTERAFYYMQNDNEFRAATAGRAIDVMEGVLVIATEDEETLTFSTASKGKVSQLNLNLTKDNSLMDRAIVRFDEGSQLPKLQFRKGSTKVYIPMEGKDYAVVNSEGMGTMPVNFKAENNGTYTLSFTTEEVSFAYLHLIDNMTGIETDLLANPSYSFEARTTDYESRFKLVFATGNNADSDSFAFYSNGSFVINNEGEATLQVIDVNGRILKSESINGCANVNVKAAAGVYVLRLVNGNDVKVQKVVVR